MLERIQQLAESIQEEVVAHRRWLHAHPELSFEEFETAAYIAQQLEKIGITPQPMATTGIVAQIRGMNPEKKTIALRADIDALPICQANQVPYKSTRKGLMHACGHDAHTACLLGAARILYQLRQGWEGTIKLIFQPGEERIPGGATMMIQEGVLQDPAPLYIIGQHVMPQLPVGKVGFRAGMYMASVDDLHIRVVGKGGHAAMPERLVDPVYMAAQLVVHLQQVVSRLAPPRIPTVLSIGRFIAEGATNIIPDEVILQGTFRTMDEDWRQQAHQKIVKLSTELINAMGGKCEIEIRKGYPCLYNDPPFTQRLQKVAAEYLGPENVVELDQWMAAEDFAYYAQQVPACFYRLGTGNVSKGIVSGVHTPTFDIDESALAIGSGLMSWLAINALDGEK
ncbi:MAG: M20 family metallopeptidase [Cytophagales bacterium]|nr:M20 family metallopeptidase [Bernardetiaceae bacterium]MDW8211658.1 M20 family metallopeptidase [Cytophagales bacterium]